MRAVQERLRASWHNNPTKLHFRHLVGEEAIPQHAELETVIAPDRSHENNDLRLYLNYFNVFYEYRRDNPSSDYSDKSRRTRDAVEKRVIELMEKPQLYRRSGHPDDPGVWGLKEDRALTAPVDEEMQRSIEKLRLLIHAKFEHAFGKDKAKVNKLLDELFKETRAANKAADTAQAVKTEETSSPSAAHAAADRGRGRSRSPISRKLPKVNPRAKEEMDAARAAEKQRAKKYFEQPIAHIELPGVSVRHKLFLLA